MSHFTKCEMKITNLIALKRALDELGFKYTESTAEVKVQARGYQGQKLDAAISIDMGKYDIAVVENEEGTYDLVADWWGVETTHGATEAELKQQINQRYTYQRVMIACEENGYTMEEEKNEEDGSIQLVARKWASGEE